MLKTLSNESVFLYSKSHLFSKNNLQMLSIFYLELSSECHKVVINRIFNKD